MQHRNKYNSQDAATPTRGSALFLAGEAGNGGTAAAHGTRRTAAHGTRRGDGANGTRGGDGDGIAVYGTAGRNGGGYGTEAGTAHSGHDAGTAMASPYTEQLSLGVEGWGGSVNEVLIELGLLLIDSWLLPSVGVVAESSSAS